MTLTWYQSRQVHQYQIQARPWNPGSSTRNRSLSLTLLGLPRKALQPGLARTIETLFRGCRHSHGAGLSLLGGVDFGERRQPSHPDLSLRLLPDKGLASRIPFEPPVVP